MSQLITKKALTLEAARAITTAAEAEANANHWPVVIAVVDEGGYPLSLARMDGAQLGSIEVALWKARCAALFKRPTKAFVERVQSGDQGVLMLPNVAPVEGGVPILVDGMVVGAVGVSGVKSHEDGQIAAAGLAAL